MFLAHQARIQATVGLCQNRTVQTDNLLQVPKLLLIRGRSCLIWYYCLFLLIVIDDRSQVDLIRHFQTLLLNIVVGFKCTEVHWLLLETDAAWCSGASFAEEGLLKDLDAAVRGLGGIVESAALIRGDLLVGIVLLLNCATFVLFILVITAALGVKRCCVVLRAKNSFLLHWSIIYIKRYGLIFVHCSACDRGRISWQ